MHTEGKLENSKAPRVLSTVDNWILSRWQQTKAQIEKHLSEYRFDLAAQTIYEFTWNEYCDWYLELCKPLLNLERYANSTRHTLISILEELLRVIHPFMPYITEAIWQRVAPIAQKTAETIMLQPYPECIEKLINKKSEEDIAWVQAVVLGIRNIRGEMNLPPSKPVPVLFYQGDAEDKRRSDSELNQILLKSLAKIDTLGWLLPGETRPQAATALVGTLEILIPLAGLIDKQAEITRLTKECGKLKLDLEKITLKLSNENFVQKAPAAVVEEEKKRAQELGAAIEKLEGRLGEMA